MLQKMKMVSVLVIIGILMGSTFLIMNPNKTEAHPTAPPGAVAWDVGGNVLVSAPPVTQIIGTHIAPGVPGPADDISIQAGGTQGIFVNGGLTGGTIGNVGVGPGFTIAAPAVLPVGTLEVDGNMVIGSAYIGGVGAAPNGLIVEGESAFGAAASPGPIQLFVSDTATFPSGVSLFVEQLGTLTNPGDVTGGIVTMNTGGSDEQYAGWFQSGNGVSLNVAGYFDATGPIGSDNYAIITENGNVGIGQLTPEGLLTVGDFTTAHNTIFNSPSSGGSTIQFRETNTWDGFQIQHDTTNNKLDITSWVGGSKQQDLMTFDRTLSHVGINNPAPGYQLDVNGDAYISGNFKVKTNLLYAGGAYTRVGIGTTSPNELLTIEGVTSMKETTAPLYNDANYGKLYVKSSDSKIYFRTDGGTEYDLTATGGGIGGIGTPNYIPKFSATTTITDSIMYESGGNIGIGTSGTPASTLEVSGTITGTGLTINGAVTGTGFNNWDKDTSNDLTTSTPFGGDVTGFYNNLILGVGVVGSAEIAANAVGSSEIAANAVGSSEIATGAVGANEISVSGVTAGTYGSATKIPQFYVDVDGRLISATELTLAESDPQVGTVTANYVPKWDSTTSALETGSIFDNGQVAIGTASPQSNAKFTVSHNDFYAGYFKSDKDSSSTHVIHAKFSKASTTNEPVAVYGESAASDFHGYGGYFKGGWIGVYAKVSPTGSQTYDGALGSVVGGSGTNRGIHGYAYNGNTNYGVYGQAGGGTTNYAGYFTGKIYATDASSGIKNFMIDHPLDPEHKYMFHSSVESSERKNIYDGVVTLNEFGEAWVELPDWFEALNEDFRYQLTCINGFAQVYIDKEIENNKFKIAGGVPDMKVSWQITGNRHDPLSDANPFQVEVDKLEEHQGKYLNPEVYGLPSNMGIHYIEPKENSDIING